MTSNGALAADAGERVPTAENGHQIRITAVLAAAANAVAPARHLATQLGPDSARAWELLELAANVETSAVALALELAEQPAAGAGH